jgi:hypothetical protein
LCFTDSVAYAAQTPWIINATLTDNITMGLPFDTKKFQSVIECCCLRPDLEMLPGGRHCEVLFKTSPSIIKAFVKKKSSVDQTKQSSKLQKFLLFVSADWRKGSES